MLLTFPSLSGYKFLLFYATCAAILLPLAWCYVQVKDRTHLLPTPPLSKPVDWYEVAYLFGGLPRLAQVATLHLLDQQHLRIASDTSAGFYRSISKPNKIEQAGNIPHSGSLSTLEKTVYDWFAPARTAKETSATDLPNRISSFGLRYEEQLQHKQLLTADSQKQAGRDALVFVGAFLVIIGGARLLAGIEHDRPVGFLIILLGASLTALYFICKPGRLSRSGKTFYRQVKAEAGNLQPATESHFTLLAAIYGMEGLSATPFIILQQFYQTPSSHSGGGCGAGGGSGGDGGGGCGGCGG